MREIPLFAIEIGDDRLIRQVRPREGRGCGEKVKGYNVHSLFHPPLSTSQGDVNSKDQI